MSSRSAQGTSVIRQMEQQYFNNFQGFLYSRKISREKDRSILFPIRTTGFSIQMESTLSELKTGNISNFLTF